MKAVSSVLGVFFCLASLFFIAKSTFSIAGRSLSEQLQHQLYFRFNNPNVLDGQRRGIRIEGEYERFRASLGLSARPLGGSSPNGSLDPDATPTPLDVVLEHQGGLENVAILSTESKSRIEASSLVDELRDEQWHDIGLRKMRKRSTGFGMPSMSQSVPSHSSDRHHQVEEPASPSFSSRIDSNSKNTYALPFLFPHLPHVLSLSYSNAKKRSSTPRSAQLFFSIDAVREPKTTLDQVFKDYSTFTFGGATPSSGGTGSAGKRNGSKGTGRAEATEKRAGNSAKARARRRERMARRRTVRLEH